MAITVLDGTALGCKQHHRDVPSESSVASQLVTTSVSVSQYLFLRRLPNVSHSPKLQVLGGCKWRRRKQGKSNTSSEVSLPINLTILKLKQWLIRWELVRNANSETLNSEGGDRPSRWFWRSRSRLTTTELNAQTPWEGNLCLAQQRKTLNIYVLWLLWKVRLAV